MTLLISRIARIDRVPLAAAMAGAALALLVGCVSEDTAGSGSVQILVSGGAALQQGFPLTEDGEELSFVDGWEVDFDKYVVAIGSVEFRDPESGAVEASWPSTAVVDLMRNAGSAQVVAEVQDVPSRRVNVGFATAVARVDADVVEADAADVAEMASSGWSLLVEGVATRAGVTVPFRVGLAASATYERCANGVDGTLGVAVQAEKTTQIVLNSHVEHLFWDSLLSDAALRFDAWASVAGADGVVSSEDLATQDLFALRNAAGDALVDSAGDPVIYDDGALLSAGQTNLARFISLAAAISFHLNGEGFCTYSLVP